VQVVSLSVKEWNELSTPEERSDFLRDSLKGNAAQQQPQVHLNLRNLANWQQQ